MSFNLPFAPHQLRPIPHSHLLPSAPKKRKRTSPPPPDVQPWDPTFTPSPLAVQASNPLSLTPSEVTQWRVAGLPLDQPHPSTTVPQFPHRRLPRSADLPIEPEAKAESEREDEDEDEDEDESYDEDDDDDEEKEGTRQDARMEGRRRRGPSHLRMQHLEVLVAILHRCLLEGDISRASRAWALLLRSESGGKPIEIKESGYWGIGAELLVRGGEQLAKPKNRLGPTTESDNECNTGSQDLDEPQEEHASKLQARWGTKQGWERACAYYERLILQYPYKRQYDHRTSALDFWPALIACEIYGIQHTYSQLLHSTSTPTPEPSSSPPPSPSSTDQAFSEIYSPASSDDGLDALDILRARHEAEQASNERWKLREKGRRAALGAASRLAARLDELMSVPPYSDSGRLLKLRGMLALYVGDLGVPGEDIEQKEAEDGGEGEDGEDGWEAGLSEGNRERWERREVQGRLNGRLRRTEREKAEEGRREAWEAARGFFKRAGERGVDCRGRIARLGRMLDGGMADGEGEEEEKDRDEEMEDIYSDDR